jgi:hypothetical protein
LLLARRRVVLNPTTTDDLEAGYAEMAADERGEAEALDWIEGLIGDIPEEAECAPLQNTKVRD